MASICSTARGAQRELEDRLPAKMKRDLHHKHARFTIIDAAKIAGDRPRKRTNNILQAAFFALTKVIPLDVAVEDMKKNNYNSYFKKAGQKIVDMNNEAVDRGVDAAVWVEIPESWANASDEPAEACGTTPFVRDIVLPMDRQQGDKLPVSVFQKYGVLDGTWENGTSAYAKRGVATSVPKWNGAKCAQCNRCAAACPHAAIRPVLLTEEEKANVPASFETVPAKGLGKDALAYSYRMQVSPYDCLGCGVCLTVCPVEGALTMTPFDEMKGEQAHFDETAMNESYLKKDVISDRNIKSLEFSKPYFQFSAACAGCAETTYLKMVSQLVGDRMYVGNAAGCSSAYSGGAPILPYCRDERGFGPAWEHSLFEDNAEFAYGFLHAQEAIRKEILIRLEAMKAALVAPSGRQLSGKLERQASVPRGDRRLLAALAQCKQTEDVQYVLENKEYLAKKIGLGHRRRRLGIRYRLRRHRPHSGAKPRYQSAGTGYRGVFQHGRPVFQGDADRRGGQVRRRRQADRQERSRRDLYELRLCLCRAGSHWLRPGADEKAIREAKHILCPDHYRVLPVSGAAYQGWYELHADRDEESGRMRLLAAVPL